jgi:hypothetical protein
VDILSLAIWVIASCAALLTVCLTGVMLLFTWTEILAPYWAGIRRGTKPKPPAKATPPSAQSSPDYSHFGATLALKYYTETFPDDPELALAIHRLWVRTEGRARK